MYNKSNVVEIAQPSAAENKYRILAYYQEIEGVKLLVFNLNAPFMLYFFWASCSCRRLFVTLSYAMHAYAYEAHEMH